MGAGEHCPNRQLPRCSPNFSRNAGTDMLPRDGDAIRFFSYSTQIPVAPFLGKRYVSSSRM